MTVLYILISTDPFGGATKSFLALLKGVTKAGVKAIVVVPDTNGIYNTLINMNVQVIVEKEKGCTWTGARNLKQRLLYIPRQLGRMAINYHAQRSLARKVEGFAIDIVHSNNSVASLGRYIAEKRKLPHLYHIREYADIDFGLRYFPSNTSFHHYLKKDGVYTACITKDIRQHHGLDDMHSSRVIYNGIINDTETPASFDQNKEEYFLYAGRIEPSKGLLTLITAYNAYRTKLSSGTPLPLMVAGEVFVEPYMESIQKYIRANHLDKAIKFLGKVTDMPTIYKHAKAIIIPSKFEGFGRCMPEAMSYGCITIAHNTGGSKEQLDNGMELTGKEIGFRYNTTEELTERLIAIHSLKESEVTEMRQRAYECVCKMYSCKTYVDSVLDFYNYIKDKKS
jgi:glycosyltransferase involved in cell wall biosynthesis